MTVVLSKVEHGVVRQYSEQELRKAYPNVMFPKGLVGVDLSQYDVLREDVEASTAATTTQRINRVQMHQFLWGIRQFGLRVQFESYVQRLEGFSRDYWLSANYVTRSNACVQNMADYFQLTESDLDVIFATGYGIEE